MYVITFWVFRSHTLTLSLSLALSFWSGAFGVCFTGYMNFITCLTMASAIILFACSYKSYDCVRISYAIFPHANTHTNTFLFTQIHKDTANDWEEEKNHFLLFSFFVCLFLLNSSQFEFIRFFDIKRKIISFGFLMSSNKKFEKYFCLRLICYAT